jgi:hypothetical protein
MWLLWKIINTFFDSLVKQKPRPSKRCGFSFNGFHIVWLVNFTPESSPVPATGQFRLRLEPGFDAYLIGMFILLFYVY